KEGSEDRVSNHPEQQSRRTQGSSGEKNQIELSIRKRSGVHSRPAGKVIEFRRDRPAIPLPDPDPCIGRQIELVVASDRIGIIPAVEIADHRDPLFGWRMGIGEQALEKIGLAIFATPDLGPAEIESLIAAEAGKNRCRAPAEA